MHLTAPVTLLLLSAVALVQAVDVRACYREDRGGKSMPGEALAAEIHVPRPRSEVVRGTESGFKVEPGHLSACKGGSH